jgi:uncharacterized phage protein gp47/JayE
MADPTPSFQDIVDIGIAEAQDVRPSLVFADGDQSTAIVRAGAAMVDHVAGWFAGQIRAMFFNGAVDDELDSIIMDRLQMPRNPATGAYGSVTFTRAGSGAANTIVSGTQVTTPADATGAVSTYLTDYDIPYPSGAFSITAGATCALPGTGGNFAVTGSPVALAIVDALPDTSITATTTGFAGGNDVESDPHYLMRAVTRTLTERRATLQALEEGALEATGVTVSKAVEDTDTGLVTVRVSDDSGESTLEMQHLADVALEAWHAAGVYVAAQGMHASQLALHVTIIDYADGFDVGAASATIVTSVTNRLAGWRPGQELTLDELRVAVIAPYATQIYKIAFAYGANLATSGITLDGVALDPTADIVPADGKSIHLQSIAVHDGKGA